ncbi:MAG: CPBP family intramembrane metalloprotease [Oscillospiraceae bacterium]|nr:CPBP family intramembrane metalloprotease [Oscillospiraceae bacterium]
MSVLLWTLLFAAISGGSLIRGILHGTLHINPDFSLASHQWLLVVGITEEMVFRGWLLNATAKDEKDWKPVAVNAVMFLCIHFPGWIQKGMFVSAITGFGFVSILIFSVLVSVCFLKHKNLLLPVFLHMLYDFMIEFWQVE